MGTLVRALADAGRLTRPGSASVLAGRSPATRRKAGRGSPAELDHVRRKVSEAGLEHGNSEISPDRGNHARRVTRAGRTRPATSRRVRYLVRCLAWGGSAAGFVICPCAAGCSVPRALGSWVTRAGRATFRVELGGVRTRRRSAGAPSPVEAGSRVQSRFSWRATCRHFPLIAPLPVAVSGNRYSVGYPVTREHVVWDSRRWQCGLC
jgi:hypothetical protein